MQRTEQINPIQFNVAAFQGNATEFVARITVDSRTPRAEPECVFISADDTYFHPSKEGKGFITFSPSKWAARSEMFLNRPER
jgi:hypothetical protein